MSRVVSVAAPGGFNPVRWVEPKLSQTRAGFKLPIYRSFCRATSKPWARSFWQDALSPRTTARPTVTCSSLIRHWREAFQMSQLWQANSLSLRTPEAQWRDHRCGAHQRNTSLIEPGPRTTLRDRWICEPQGCFLVGAPDRCDPAALPRRPRSVHRAGKRH